MIARLRTPLIGLALAVVLGVAFFFGLSRPLAAERDALAAETATLETQARELELEIARLEEVRDAETQITAAIERIDELVPDGVEQPVTLDLFQASAEDAAVTIESLVYEPVAPVEGAPPTGDADTVLAAVPVTMVIEGGYFQTVDFFRRLETDVSRAVLVETVATAAGTDGFPTLTTTWTGKVFAVVEALVDPAAEGAAAPAEAVPPAEGATEGATEGVATPGDPAAAPGATDATTTTAPEAATTTGGAP